MRYVATRHVFLHLQAIPSCAALLFPFLFLLGCASAPSSFYLAPEYRNIRESNVSILVLPYVRKLMTPEQWEPFIARKTKEQKLVTNLEIELYEGYFQTLLAERTQARVIPYGKVESPTGVRLRYMEIESGIEPKMNLLVPESAKIRINGETPEYLFVVQDLFFMKGKVDGPGRQVPGRGNEVDYYMESGIDYLIWDNKHDKTVACGKLTKRTRLLAPPGKDQYLKVLEEFVDSIVKNSPLAQKTISF
jgi:hypothetical protein